MSLRILLVDDHEVVRLGVRALIERQPGMEVVGEATTVREAVSQVEQLAPDVVVLDIRLPGGDGLDACRQIKDLRPETRIIVLTSYPDDEVLFDAIACGADGYVLKQIGSDDLIRALEQVGRGESLLDPSVTDRVFAKMREVRQQERAHAGRGHQPSDHAHHEHAQQTRAAAATRAGADKLDDELQDKAKEKLEDKVGGALKGLLGD